MSKKKVLLIGWDAADWQIIWPLIKAGKMPALEKLIKNGVYANMSTLNPPYSPMLWTSVATGKTPDKHGILGFIEADVEKQQIKPVSSLSRKTRAIWNIFHNQGLKSNVVGWWPTNPPEPINGVMVSDFFQKQYQKSKGFEDWPLPDGVIHPESFKEQLKECRMHPNEMSLEQVLAFMPTYTPQKKEEKNEKDGGVFTLSKVLAQNVSIHAAATRLMRTTEWDFMAVYYDFIDHMCHAFMKFHPPQLKGLPDHIFERNKDIVNNAYQFQDMMLDRMISMVGEDTNIIVMSDHGYESGNKRIVKMPKFAAAPALEHRQFGMFVAAGPDIKKGEKLFGLSLIDIAPTLLHMFDMPVGKDMDGKPILGMFNEQKKVSYIDSWDAMPGDFGEHSKLPQNTLDDEQVMQQLIDLGYIDKPDEDKKKNIKRAKCDNKHNLARVYLGKSDFATAKKLLYELIEEQDVDLVPYFLELLNLTVKEENYEEAAGYLAKLRGLEKTFLYTTDIVEAKILVGTGKLKEARVVLNKAIAQKPNKSALWYELAKLNLAKQFYKKAKQDLEKAIAIENDNARYHQLLAHTLVRLEAHEEAIEHAFISIELVNYFPEAHYTLGEALEKMGDLENAKIAFETAARLKPKQHHRANKAIENIEEKLTDAIELTDKVAYKHRENQIVVVSGLPRSGTSLMMQMLHQGGLTPLTDSEREADVSNPKGYLEYKPVMSIHKDNSWLEKAQNKVVKIVAPLLNFTSPAYRYKVIFMTRDLTEVVMSQQKMKGEAKTLPLQLVEKFKKQLQLVNIWKDKEPGVELIYVDYKELLNGEDATLLKITDFVGIPLDIQKMKGAIDTSLYRNRVTATNESSTES
ncbi:alkaline phosphatase family protein [Neptunitalea lumnitzerae]|uniref:Uncharacterized protein n=1 Tax=Neptunitalea lumnitzerae TaxID=2965509 RepID=A0ABQ5MM59_9FLAO|nr:alkaline phosphatase family protein [Neptunitalea sp. Y10]GLB50448.1 hypothetical protein Y10_28160 [Neptunitalea sp. Y10]